MKRWLIIVFFACLVGVSGFLITKVKINYDLSEYLPKDSEIAEGIETLDLEFGTFSNSYIAINTNSINQALTEKNYLMSLENVKDVVFIDTYLNELTYSIIKSNLPTEQQQALDFYLNTLLQQGLTFPEALYEISENFPEQEKLNIQNLYHEYISDNYVLYQVIFNTKASDPLTEETLNTIKQHFETGDYEVFIKGEAASNIFTRNTINQETTLITIVIIPLIMIVLLLFSKSLFDIIIFVIVAGVSIIINLGTNAILPNISYITQSMAIALQLAISLDYIIFTMHSYHSERKNPDVTPKQAIKLALKKIHRPVIASALTTMVSFLALIIMRFSIGLDIGLVFAKAILISLLTTLILLPVLVSLFAKLIDKTKTKSKLIDFTWFARFAEKQKKFRYVYLVFLGLIIAPLVYFQTQNSFTYGVNSFSASEGTSYYEDSTFIDNEFGLKNTYYILIEKNDLAEGAIYQELANLDYIKNIEAGIYYKSIIQDPETLKLITENLYSENYALINLSIDSDVESDLSFAQYEEIRDIIETQAPNNSHILGETAISYEIKDIILRDFTIVLILAIISVMVIIFFSFKNLLIPTILIIVIETAVFLSMSILNLFSQDQVFLAYLIVNAILLGATIDYAILFSKRYLEMRENFSKNESIKKASLESTPSIVTSAMLFIIAGLALALISSINSIAQIGLLIAVGAFVSMLFVLVLLPQILYIFDFLIIKSKVKIQ